MKAVLIAGMVFAAGIAKAGDSVELCVVDPIAYVKAMDERDARAAAERARVAAEAVARAKRCVASLRPVPVRRNYSVKVRGFAAPRRPMEKGFSWALAEPRRFG